MKRKVQRLMKSLLHYEPQRVYLFGSWARGEEDELSDLDVVVIKKTDSSFFDRLRDIASLLPLDLGGVDVLVYTPDEFEMMQRQGNAFAEMLNEEALVIYDQQTQN
jgi:predicted nucleotidyltransferase